MRRTYVLDTSALIHDPFAYRHFPHSDVIIPIATLREIDKLKKGYSEVARHARVVARTLDEIGETGDLTTGILLDDDILLRGEASYIDLSLPPYCEYGDPLYGDTQILAATKKLWDEHPTHDVVLVSNDNNLRLQAKFRGIDSQKPEDKAGDITSELYAGSRVVIDEDAGLELQQHRHLDPRAFNLRDLSLHECIMFRDGNGNAVAMGRKVAADKVKLIRKIYPWDLSARNKEQAFAIDLMMDPDIDLVTLIGRAGCGKSLCVLATALELVLHKKAYDKLVIYRPIQPVGNDIGYLPGLESEKLAPWFQAIMDSFEHLFTSKTGGDWRRELEMCQRKGKIEMNALTYIRGRNISNAILFLDEGQNITKEEMKTILTRAGEGTKVVVTGDLDQIDKSSLDATNNGLTYIIDKFKSSELAGHITFTQGERSRLATLAAEIL